MCTFMVETYQTRKTLKANNHHNAPFQHYMRVQSHDLKAQNERRSSLLPATAPALPIAFPLNMNDHVHSALSS
jgi:hypothetical protein